MSDIFLTKDLQSLLRYKKVVFIGDSNIRAYYKDMLCLSKRCEILDQTVLKTKMENTVFGDRLMHHGEKFNGREYKEERKYVCDKQHFEFYFITRVFNDYVRGVLDKVVKEGQPDVLIINSCLWDLCRWGPNGVSEFKENVMSLMKYLNSVLSDKCLVIWVTAPPLSTNVRGGFLVVQLDFLKYCLRFHVMEANTYCRKVVVQHGYDVLDLHYHLRMQLQRRGSDGIHWLPTAVRYITNLLLTHISLAWGVSLPHRYESMITERIVATSDTVEGLEKVASPPMKKTKQESAKKKKKSKKSKNLGPSYYEFAKQEKLRESQHRIRSWANDVRPPGLFPVERPNQFRPLYPLPYGSGSSDTQTFHSVFPRPRQHAATEYGQFNQFSTNVKWF